MNRYTSDKGGSPAEQGLGYLFKSGEGRSPDAELVEKVARAIQRANHYAPEGTPDNALDWTMNRSRYLRDAAASIAAYNPNERPREASPETEERLVVVRKILARHYPYLAGKILAGEVDNSPEMKSALDAFGQAIAIAPEVEALKHDVTCQMAIANAECNEVERLREAFGVVREELATMADRQADQRGDYLYRGQPDGSLLKAISLIDAALSHTIPIDRQTLCDDNRCNNPEPHVQGERGCAFAYWGNDNER